MRVLLISVDFTPHRDGVSSLSRHYARRLAERGHEVTVVGPRARGARQEDEAAPYGTFRFPGYSLGVLRMLPFAAWSLAVFFRRRPDIVFAMNVGYGGVLCHLLSRVVRCRYVTLAYAYEFLKFRSNPGMRRRYLRVYGRSAGVLAISDYARNRLIEFGVSPDRIRVVHPGTAPDEGGSGAAPAAPPAGIRPPVIGTCGRLIERKGHDLVIRALPGLVRQFPDVRYRIAGTGPARATLQTLARELGVESNVEFLGEVSRPDLARFYRSLDVFVMASREDARTGHVEGFGIVYLEAATYGVPSVGTRTGGIPEAIIEGKTGLLVEPESPQAVAAAVAELLGNPAKRADMGRAARERALNDFTWDRQVDRVHEWLMRLELACGAPVSTPSGGDRAADGLARPAGGGPGLRVAVLTRTGRSSGLRFAAAIRHSRHVLCGVLAEKRSTMLLAALRRGSLRDFVRKHSAELIFARLWRALVGGMGRQAAPGADGGADRPRGDVSPVRVDSLNSEAALRALREWKPDLIVVANAPVLKPEVFGASRLGAINFHSGRLPEYGGVDSEFWALYDGQAQTWITFHQVRQRLDSGAILAERPIDIQPGDTPERLYARAVETGAGLLVELLDRMAAGAVSPVRDPGPAVLRPWPAAAQRRELRRRLMTRAAHTTSR